VRLTVRMRTALAGCAAGALLASCSASPAHTASTGTAGPPSVGAGAPLRILTPGASSGDIFLGVESTSGYTPGPEIVSTSGKVIWFRPLPPGSEVTDVRPQTYRGQPVLTWYQDVNGVGEGVIDNDHFQRIATVKPGDGDQPDFHEFLITPWNTALILATDVTTVNLTSIGGSAHQQVLNGIVQEIDIATGKVLFQWDSAGHVPFSDSHAPPSVSPSVPWDWFHINAVHLDTDGNLLISSRYTWTIYKVSIHTGAIIWELGGKQSSFRLRAAPGQVLDQAGEIFAFQHDPVALGGGEYSVFDDESDGGVPLLAHSRAVIVRLDLATRTATLIWSASQPEGMVAGAMGSAQRLSNGDMFISWGGLGSMSEFSSSGKLLYNASLPPGVYTYRAYLLPWPPG
jgi:hypothetical protein